MHNVQKPVEYFLKHIDIAIQEHTFGVFDDVFMPCNLFILFDEPDSLVMFWDLFIVVEVFLLDFLLNLHEYCVSGVYRVFLTTDFASDDFFHTENSLNTRNNK